eukprot:3138137-Ditylum_brightwellii.AAC.1
MAQTDNDMGKMEEDMDDIDDVPHLMPRSNDEDSSDEEDSDDNNSSYSPSENKNDNVSIQEHEDSDIAG